MLALCGKLNSVPPNCAILGMDEGAVPLLLRIDSPDVAHALLSGTTGSGKTALLRTLLLSLTMFNHPGQLQLALIDPKGRGLAPLAGLPHLWRGGPIAQGVNESLALLEALIEEMVRRDTGRHSLPHIVLGIDELADLLVTGGKPVADALTRLTQRGREAGIHVVAATQKPAATLVGGLVKANFPVRLVGSVVSPEDARVAAGISGTGAERLLGRGDFLLVTKGQVIRFQAAYASGAELAAIVARIGTGGRRRRSWQMRDGRPDLPAASSTGSVVSLGGRLPGTRQAGGLFSSLAIFIHRARPEEGGVQ